MRLKPMLLFAGLALCPELRGSPRYHSPFDLVCAPDGITAYLSDRTGGSLWVLDLEARRTVKEIPLHGQPAGLSIAPGGERVYAAEYDAGTVAEIDPSKGTVSRRFAVGLRPMGLALAPRRGKLAVANTVENHITIIDLASGRESARIEVPREPFFAAVSPDERLLLAANLLPATPASDPSSSAALSLIDLETERRVADIRLPPGSTSVREVRFSPDGRRAYCAHTLGRFNVASVQLDRGWVYTNAVSIIDLASREVHAAMLLDGVAGGAGNPWGLWLTGDGRTLWAGLRGTHQVARVDLGKLERLLAGDVPEDLARPAPAGPGLPSFWLGLKEDPSRRRELMDDLGALHAAGVIERFEVGGLGPRAVRLSPDERTLLAACYHSGEVALLEARTGKRLGSIPIGPRVELDLVRRGEIIFHDATVSFQHWMSCSSCHPDEGRSDGLRWDLPNDGLGTPQRTRSLLWAHLARPTTARGVRPGVEASAAAGFHFLGVEPEAEDVRAVIAYITSLTPEPSPHLAPGGRLTAAAERGREVFEGKGGCESCHRGPARSDHRPHDVGTAGEMDRPRERFITKRLVELYRAAPYLHDGRAATLEEVFAGADPGQPHGRWAELSSREREDLISYLLSL